MRNLRLDGGEWARLLADLSQATCLEAAGAAILVAAQAIAHMDTKTVQDAGANE